MSLFIDLMTRVSGNDGNQAVESFRQWRQPGCRELSAMAANINIPLERYEALVTRLAQLEAENQQYKALLLDKRHPSWRRLWRRVFRPESRPMGTAFYPRPRGNKAPILAWFTIEVTILQIRKTTETQRHGDSWDRETRRWRDKGIAILLYLPISLSPCRLFLSVSQCLRGCFLVCKKVLP